MHFKRCIGLNILIHNNIYIVIYKYTFYNIILMGFRKKSELIRTKVYCINSVFVPYFGIYCFVPIVLCALLLQSSWCVCVGGCTCFALSYWMS